MKGTRWFLLAALASLFAGGWAAVSCAIDDDITWANGSQCTGTCSSPPPSSYDCDIDSNCTPSDGCEDWDCSEQGGDWVGPDVLPPGDSGPFSDAGEVRGDVAAGGDVPDDGETCVPVGVGLTREQAEPLTAGLSEPGLTACLAASGWMRFDVLAGTRFELELAAAEGATLGFQLYAGTDPAVLAVATIDGTGTFGLEAAASATFFVRVRALTFEPTSYALTLREL
jgi:hypothetical protein